MGREALVVGGLPVVFEGTGVASEAQGALPRKTLEQVTVWAERAGGDVVCLAVNQKRAN
ncbi:hypothetical protein [Corynebacterium sp. 13CS0277]|uniref:hypothetical protein n=1 Tax=Corynebacterium sp. 13CS0277 TaxID=2071994 RepID=UPI001304CDEF|nr:hypothetical protein [Corynebacterium sp. 13CS0277]